jgi:DNA-binding LacI/PurR family transcriptional regulator
MSRRVALSDLAAASGFTTTTVSLALRNHPRISAVTSAKIKALADELGYKPDPLLSKLMTHLHSVRMEERNEVIAWLTGYSRAIAREDQFLCEVRTGAGERAERYGYRLEDFSLREKGMNASRMSRILYNRGIVGLVVAPLREGLRHLSLAWSPFAASTFGYTLMRPNLHRAAPHQFANMITLLRQLRHLGYSKPGFMTSEELDKRVGQTWRGAFLAFQQNLPVKDRVPLLVSQSPEPSPTLKWFSRYKPDVIVSDRHDVRGWLEDAGYHVPGDVGLASPSLSGQTLELGFSGIDEFPVQIGAATVDFVVAQINRNEQGIPAFPRVMLIEGVWKPGSTVKFDRRRDAISVSSQEPSAPEHSPSRRNKRAPRSPSGG